MEGDTVRLRSAAPRWSLEGDSQLLSVLQTLHQKIITKCQETNSQLDAMVNALDNASIDLQNVNNKFMALSNSQFVESRVYEDEEALTQDDTHQQESPKPEVQSSLSSLKLGLQVLESLHEAVAIVASDSDDEEQSPRRVLRPRGRGRLPPVLSARAWTEHTHYDVCSDDSEDSSDKRASALEEYSDSDTDLQHASSSSLSSMTSHAPHPPATSHTPSEHDAQTEEQIPEPALDEPPKPRKLYTVEKHISAQIFPDEPPPLDKFEADSDDDIFAELHKQSNPHSNKGLNVAEDLFGSGSYDKRHRDDNEIGNVVTTTVDRENSPLFSRPQEPESKVTPTRETYSESGVKKPVGGISLFGSKGAESIGAAILKRNQRQSSSESDTQTNKPNIIDDLFAKPVKNIKQEPSKVKKQAVVKDKILFSDNIFDDIDDIFTSDVITKTTDNKHKETLFDDDLFENDNNDLFNDKNKDKDINQSTSLNKSNKDTKEKIKSIFDSDSEDDLFSDVKLKDNSLLTNIREHTNDKSVIIDNVTHTEHNTDKEKSSELKASKTVMKVVQLKHQLSPNIFDDENEDDLFGDKIESKENSQLKTEIAVISSDEIQQSDEKKHDLKSDIINNEVKVTETEAEIKVLENEQSEKKNVSDIKNVDEPNNDGNSKISIIQSEMYKEDIDRSSIVTKNNEVDVTAVISDPKVLSPPEINFLEETKTTNEEDISREVTKQNHSKDIFVDIFDDLPPAFEKPMESKKSKNVNALFDDDSDDEALFFKKDDVITDEKPDFEYKNDRFQIFHDEPPDIDLDFSQKLRNTNQIPDTSDLSPQEDIVIVKNALQSNTTEKHLLTTTETPIEKETLIKNQETENTHSLDDSKSTTKNEQTGKIDILKLLESERDEDIFETNKYIEEDIFSDPDKNDSNEELSRSDVKVYTNKDDTDSSENEKKPVGKLRPVTININVSSLLPGAVPKKSKTNEETDGQTASRSNEENNPDVTEPQMVKTVSFKGSPDSEVLDNKLSKERAKIQVKRRPSTRRARLEAVRKSGLDFGSDSTDNSSSFDEPIKVKHKNDKTNVPYKKLKDESKLNSELNDNNDATKDVTSKVVYILHDEDIFSSAQGAAVDASADIAHDLFKPISNKRNSNENLPHHTIKDRKQTLEDTVSEKQFKKMDKPKKWLFDDISDDDTELFKKPVQKSIFDSDSESELFSENKSKAKREKGSKEEQKKLKETKADTTVRESKVEKKVTKALFSDSDSDEELFGGKTNRPDFKELLKPNPSTTKTSQTFEDPLSMLDET